MKFEFHVKRRTYLLLSSHVSVHTCSLSTMIRHRATPPPPSPLTPAPSKPKCLYSEYCCAIKILLGYGRSPKQF